MVKNKQKERINMDIKDLIAGIGIGLCFSKFYPVGILLIVLITIICLIELEEKKKLKKE